jgi:hypothetical protein
VASLVVTGASPDAWLVAHSQSVYADARAGIGVTFLVDDTSTLFVGQSDNPGPNFFNLNEAVIQFDTSSLPNGANVKTVLLELWGIDDSAVQDFTVLVAAHDFGGTIDSADWLPGDTLELLEVLAEFASAGFAVGAYNAFTSNQRAFARAINRAGNTRLVLFSDRLRDGIPPVLGTNEYLGFQEENAGGTANDPKLTITYTVDMVVEVSLSNLGGDTDEECGVTFRLSNASNFLAAYVDDGDNLVHLSKFVAGVETSIATAAWSPADTAEIRAVCQDNRIRVWVDRKLAIDALDATHDGNERAGLFSRSTTAVPFKNFYAQGL